MDHDAARALALKTWQYKQGELVATMIYVGRRLGLYETLHETGPAPSAAIARAAELDERWVREWLDGQAAAGLIQRSVDGVYSLTAEQVAVLVDENSLLYATSAFTGGTEPHITEGIIEAFRTGRGFTYEEQGELAAEALDGMNQAWNRSFLPDVVIPMLDGVVERLERGARAIDVGCGGAVTLEALGQRYPNSTFHGVDPSSHAVNLAAARNSWLDNVEVWVSGGEDLPANGDYDLVMTLDILHDLPHPERIFSAVRNTIADDGVWLVKDMKAAETFEGNLRNPVLAMMYGYSLTSCLASATSEPDGAALGTLGLTPSRVQAMADDAGFSSVAVHKTDDPTHLYYEVRP